MSDPQHYTVGWICAIPTEYTAARQFLDEEHDRPAHDSAHDSNDYTLGKMAGHNVVIAVLPDGEYGVSSATAVAKDMLHSFPNVRVGLMVGIGGGAPTAKNDIRLGDVVVSSRKGSAPCVYQYNYGKTIQGRSFEPTGFLNQPPAVVRTAVSGLRSKYEEDGHQIEAIITEILGRKPRLRQKYSRPSQECDRLYMSHVIHPVDDKRNCEEVCGSQTADVVQRRERREDEDNPTIHYGVIASADQLMKDAITRDAIAKEKDVLCFEMEAAGLMNHFPCLVVRGICDYSDSHKNKEWQGYAAMTAAAYAKNILTRMIPSRVEREKRLGNVLAEIEKNVTKLYEETKSSTDVLKAYAHSTKQHQDNKALRQQNKKNRDCHRVFKTSTYEHFKNINPEPAEETCQWALDHPLYQRWTESTTDDLLWISADPGCGKSVLSKSLVDERLMSDAIGSTICYFFFKDNDEQNSLATCLCALLHQLFRHQPHLLQHAFPAWSDDGNKLQQETDKLWHILLAATSDAAAHNTICVLDALDECKDEDRSNLIDKLAQFHKNAADSQPPRQSWLKFIVTSRPYDDIQIGFQDIPTSLPAIRLRGEEENDQICTEINRVINLKVRQLANRLGLRESTSSRLEQTLLAMEHRTYLWLHLAIDDIRTTLQDSFTPDEEPIESVPSSVEGAYEKILSRVPEARRQKVKLILRIIVGARRPLAVGEMALALGLATSTNVQNNAIHLENQLRHWCGLFVFVNRSDSRIYLIHQTAREFLVARERMSMLGVLKNSLWMHSLEHIEIEKTMAEICIRCLNLEDLKMLLYDDPTGKSDQKEFVEYCCEWWTTHYSFSESAAEEDTFRDALKLYETESEYRSWFSRFHERTRYAKLFQEETITRRIQCAAYNGHARIFKYFLSVENADAEATDNYGRSALYWASAEGHSNIVQILFDAGADWDAQSDYGTPLHAASEEGHDKIVQMLLNKGADVNAQSGYGSALQAASVRGHDNVVRMLLNKGADVNAQGEVYGTALRQASEGGHDNIVQMLLSKDVDVDAKDGLYGNALQAASAEGYNNIVRMLLNKGADVNARGGYYGSALQAASASAVGHDDIVRMLLNKGADVNAQGGLFRNALQAASRVGHDKIVQMLLDRGADVNAQGGHHGSALRAASVAGHDNIVHMLLDRGADVNACYRDCDTALQAASVSGYDKIVQLLLERGADVNDQSGDYTALQTASARGHDKIVQMLLDNGADINARSRRYDTPLQLASSRGHDEIVQMLLDNGADVNQSGRYGTPLETASRMGRDKIVQMLLDNGADVNDTAIGAAHSEGHDKIVQMLRDARRHS
ncbi:purine and uridine phosphorylase, partial [Aureobasidium melanogenum]